MVVEWRAPHCTPVASCLMVVLIIGKKLALGYNSDREAYAGCGYRMHSEMDAINKLKVNRGSRLIIIDVYITRVNKSGEMRNSKPCNKCCKHMNVVALKKGYRVKKVFYPDETCNVIEKKFEQVLKDSANYFSSHFIRSGRYKIKPVVLIK